MRTPWGESQHVDLVAPGITSVSTAGHGGYKLDPVRMSAVFARFPHFRTFAGGPWFEEDCDWAIVALTFPEHFSVEALRGAIKTVEITCKIKESGQTYPVKDTGWDSVAKWLKDDPEGQRIRCMVAYWEIQNKELWERGSMGTTSHLRYPEGASWRVHFHRIKDDAKRVVCMEYPEKAFYTTEELDALEYKGPLPTPAPPKPQPSYAFNEAGCGGTFDGFSVTSDADPGL